MHDANPPIRQILYQSAVEPALMPAEIASLATRASAKNRTLGITGLLLEAEGRFVQFIEGEAAIIGPLYAAIAFDRRHAAVTTLLDRRSPARAYAEWDMRRGTWPSLQAEAGTELAPILAHLPPQSGTLQLPAWPPPRPAETAPQPGDPRVRPLQIRAKASLERMVEVAHLMVVEAGRFDRLSLTAVAGEAGLAPSSVYRYVPDIEALFRLGLQRRLDAMNRRFIAFMANRDFPDPYSLAEAMVDFSIVRALSAMPRSRAHARLTRAFLRRYHLVRSEDSRPMAEILIAGMPPGCPCRAIGVVRLAAGLVALANIIRALLIEEGEELQRPETRGLLISICLGAFLAPAPMAAPVVPGPVPRLGH